MPVTAAPLFVLVAGLIFGCLSVWAVIADRLMRRQPIVTYEPRFAVPWTGPDLVVIAALVMLAYTVPPLVALAQQRVFPARVAEHGEVNAPGGEKSLGNAEGEEATEAPGAEKPPRRHLRITPLVAMAHLGALLGCCGLIIIGLRLFAGATWDDLGLRFNRIGYDVKLGLGGTLAATLPVYTIQGIMTSVFRFESKHPLLEMLEREPSLTNLAVSVGLAALMAPVAEEFLFRVLLQGWLEAKEASAEESGRSVLGWLPRGAGPIAISALVFAVMHSAQGPDPVALFPLAVVMGYLYRQTHRLLPSAVMHLGFNGLTLTVLWVSLTWGK